MKEEILATAVKMRSGMEFLHWSIKTVAKNGGIGIQGRSFFIALNEGWIALTPFFLIFSELQSYERLSSYWRIVVCSFTLVES